MKQPIRLFLFVEATTFIAAALIHFGVLAHGLEHQKAGTAETVIAAVLVTGFAACLASARATRRVALAAQGFALFGTLVGIVMIAIGVGPRTGADIGYHAVIVIVLICGLMAAGREPTPAA
ncbi:MAG: hypothetical protein JWL71_3402 [Acidobacteria bacterium]|nr:hypothetical protein [Acidobacteriota bacterium]